MDPDMIDQIGSLLGKDKATIAKLKQMMKNPRTARQVQELLTKQLADKQNLEKLIPKQPIKRSNKIGRNDKCPCESGKKYKKCCINKPPTPEPITPDTETQSLDETPVTPSAVTPSDDTPSAETPSAETPSAETPSAETPSAETPSDETPSAVTLDAEILDNKTMQ